MQRTHTTLVVSATIAAVVLALFFFGMGARDVHAIVGVDGSVDARVNASTSAPLRPLKATSTKPYPPRATSSVPVREKIDNLQERIQDKRETIQETIDAKRAQLASSTKERRDEARDRAKERILMIAGKIAERLQAAVDRYNGMVERIESHIDKLKDRGVNTTEMEAKLAVAVDEISDAQDSVDALIVALETSVDDDATVKENFARVRDLIKETTEQLKEAHRALVEVIVSLKASAALRTATTTPSTATTTPPATTSNSN